MGDLTKNLSWHEVLRYSGVSSKDEMPPELVKTMIERTGPMFQALREAVGMPITIVSGYRDPATNRRAGGAKKSRHMLAQALDCKCADMDTFYYMANEMQRDGRLEAGGLALYTRADGTNRFVHVDCRGRRARWSGGKRKGHLA
jgi:uncharacterized protein YcbK (DUF882 family)